ncbi:hypothetical protein DNTS_004666 [Danionella cerebrum]|uniref:Centrosomin N-terminal motif 1 domain-containing protein n=1 Tax=Danionella cerebrum TaxID=2873325 RepID=A0A553QYG0_9TELE|nr:hypothetical protein DNTS_004666 [Danionella translucida]
MDSVVGEDQTLPFDISLRLPEPLNGGDFNMENISAPLFPGQRMSPAKALTMKDYENQITALKKENFNLKLRIYFLEERVQQKCDDSTEEIFKTNIELKVEVESMKRDLAEKQELLVSASKALESLASRGVDDGREKMQREMDSLRDAFSARIQELEEVAHEELESMATIAEQEKLKNLGLERELQAANQSGASTGPGFTPEQVLELQQALQEKESVIEQLQTSLRDQGAVIEDLQKNEPNQSRSEQLMHLNTIILQKEDELQALRAELDHGKEISDNDRKMRDPCRLCGGCVPGGQCRWLFSACGRLRLAVVLSHVVGEELTRDGRSEFLCGKCSFLLERVVQCDVAIGQMQETHAARLQRVQNERDGLKVQITNKYRQHNSTEADGNVLLKQETGSSRINIIRGVPRRPLKETVGRNPKCVRTNEELTGRLRRSVSLEPLSKVGLERSQHSKLNSSSRSKTTDGLAARPRALSRGYLDVVNKKSALISRSTSLQSVAWEQPDHALVRQTRPLRGSTHVTKETTSVVVEVLQLLRMVRGVQPIRRGRSSKIPVLKCERNSSGSFLGGASGRSGVESSLREMEEDFSDDYSALRRETLFERQNELNRLEQRTRQLAEELNTAKSGSQTLKDTLEEIEQEKKTLSDELQKREIELTTEKKNSLKRDKTIQGLTLILKEKEKEGAEDQQSLVVEQQAELSRLQAEAHASLLEAQRLQRALGSRDSELSLLQQSKQQLEQELEQLQQQKKKADKNINDLQNQLKKLNGALTDREGALEQQRLEQQEQKRASEQKHQNAVERLTANLSHKEQQLQDYMSMVRDLEKNSSLEESQEDPMLSKLRARLKEKEKALEKTLDEKFAAEEEKENQIHLLQLSLREKERDLERLNNLLSHNQETIDSFDSLIKERDVELQQLLNSMKNLQRSKEEAEENLQRALREKDVIIQHLQKALENKTRDLEEMASQVLNQSESQGRDLAEQMSQRLKVTEVMMSEAVKDRERLVMENQTAVENLLATISSKDQLLKEAAERHTQAVGDRAAELQEVRSQLSEMQQQLRNAHKQNSAAAAYLEASELRAVLAEKDGIINKLLERGQEKDRILLEIKSGEAPPPQVLELRQTIEVLQEKLEEREAELSRRNSEEALDVSALSKKSAVVLKKDLSQKTEALNAALKRENQLKMSLAELRCTVSDLEARVEGQAASIESLTSTLHTKEQIITVGVSHLMQTGNRFLGTRIFSDAQIHDNIKDKCEEGEGGGVLLLPSESMSGFPQELHQRLSEKGGAEVPPTRDPASQLSESEPSLPPTGGDLQQEGAASLSDLRREQAELNRALRAEHHLYSDLIRAVKERDSVERLQVLQLELTAVSLLRQQLENGVQMNEELREELQKEIQRAKEREVDTLSSYVCGDQTSYMSICVGEGPEEELLHATVAQLRAKVAELETINAELQKKMKVVEDDSRASLKEPDLIDLSSPVQRTQRRSKRASEEPSATIPPNIKPEMKREPNAQPSRSFRRNESEKSQLAALLSDCGAESVSELRDQVAKLRSEASQLHRLLKEESAAESKESAESSAESDSPGDVQRTVKILRSEARSHRKIIRLLKEQLEKTPADGDGPGTKAMSGASHEMQNKLRVDSPRDASRPEDKSSERKDKEVENKRPGGSKLNKKHHMTRHAVYVRSRLPVPVRSSRNVGLSSEDLSGIHSEHVHPKKHMTVAEESDDSSGDKMSSRSSQQRLEDDAPSNGAQRGSKVDQSPESELVLQLHLLNQECQEKEELISKLTEQLQEWDDLREELQEKDRLNREYLEALQAAESTIAYLTACSLDSECGIGQTVSSWAELQKALEEKEQVSAQLLDVLTTAESTIASLRNIDTTGVPAKPEMLCERLEDLVKQLKAAQQSVDGSERVLRSDSELRRPVDTPQESVLQQCKLNVELQEKLWSSEAAVKKLNAAEGLEGDVPSGAQNRTLQFVQQRTFTDSLSECIAAAEGAVQCLTEICSNPSELHEKTQSSPDFSQWMERLQGALLERDALESGKQSGASDRAGSDSKHLSLLQNLQTLLQIHTGNAQKLVKHSLNGGAGDAVERNSQIERLQKMLKEKQRACQKLEDKLALAQSIIAAFQEDKAPPGERDDKGVQVEAQDLGYETSGRSETEVEGSSTDAVQRSLPGFSPVLPGIQDRVSPDITTASTPSYPSSPGLSSPRLSSDPSAHAQKLRIQVGGQQKVLQKPLRKKSVSSELLSETSDCRAGKDDDEESRRMKALSSELEGERSLSRSSQSGSPSRVESLVQSQARELSELREQIRVSRGFGLEQRKLLLELRGALEELLQPDAQLQEQLDRSLSLLETLEQVSSRAPGLENHEAVESQSVLGLSAELKQKDSLIEALQHQLRMLAPGVPSDSETSDQLSTDDCRPHSGLKETNSPAGFAEVELVSVEGGVANADEGSVLLLQRENGRLQEQLRSSEEMNATLRSELDLTSCILKPAPREAAERPAKSASLSSAEHLQEIRALRLRLEETIRTNERLREQLEKKLQEAEKDPGELTQRLRSSAQDSPHLGFVFFHSAATNIFIAGSEDQPHVSRELHILLMQNRTLKEQLNQGARDKQKENERLRETLARRTAKLELSRKESEALKLEITRLQDALQRHQKQQLCNTQQLLQSTRVELQVHEHIKSSSQAQTGEEPPELDLSELLSEIKRLRVQLERSIRIHASLRQALEQQLLVTSAEPSSSTTFNLHHLLPATEESSSADSASMAPSRLVPGHRLWADRRGRHVLGLMEDYNALRKQISEARRLTADLETHADPSGLRTGEELKSFSVSLNTMQQVLEEAARLLKLLWRVSLPSGDGTHSQQDELLRSEMLRLKSRVSQQERMLSGAVKRLRSSNQLKEGMERAIIQQRHPPECPVTNQEQGGVARSDKALSGSY